MGKSRERSKCSRQLRRSEEALRAAGPSRLGTDLQGSLEKFGSLDSVGQKLLGAERAKESTKSAIMVSQNQRAGPSGTTMYDFDYIIDSTRGTKRVLNTVTISQRRLFIANGLAIEA
ncbi:hypothetical protein WJX73_005684 [Symbiochloris irregularis]|uniref:PsbP C-terminal domain-containing protein n=1 Tax=Symbiochloris irregularis TaxID=706552 RepID=A0AAW1NVP3_9CHLO